MNVPFIDFDTIECHPAPIETLFAGLRDYGCQVEPCGSRVTCNPAPRNTDADYLVVVPPNAGAVTFVIGAISHEWFKWEGSEHYQDAARNNFMSWRRDDVNLIVTASPEFAARHRAATALCKRLNLLSKPDRVAVFQAVLYANAAI